MKLTLSLMRLSSKLAERLEKYGRYYPSPLTIQHIIDFGKSQLTAIVWTVRVRNSSISVSYKYKYKSNLSPVYKVNG